MIDKTFNIPIVLFIFRRSDTMRSIIERISQVKPEKIYLLSDQGRNEEERLQVRKTRETVEKLIDWPCQVIKNYAESNRGVYGNIGLGAKWVFEHERCAIFLEDDNLPDVSFFDYCKQMLYKYEHDENVLWVCGTNYLGEYRNNNNDSYMFTHNLLPCGWASWSDKFLKYYDFGFHSVKTESDIHSIRDTYVTKSLYKQEQQSILTEYYQGVGGERYRSWDYHMIYSVRKNKLFGISPARNLIENIGVDEISEHGGTSIKDVMTRRFCGVPTLPLEHEMNHPKEVKIDLIYEKKIEKIITKPLKIQISTALAVTLRKVFKIPKGVKTRDFFLRRTDERK